MSKRRKTIVLTGGGTAGHVTPNVALIPELKKRGYKVYYIGSKDGPEREMMRELKVPYYAVKTGKFWRYITWHNLTAPFRVLRGYNMAKLAFDIIKPDVVFSKGGFVAVPVVTAAQKLGIPTIIHESDMTPGLANKICMRKAKKVCCNFPETVDTFPKGKALVTGTPIRKELYSGDRQKGLEFTGLSGKKPVLLAMGGSQGAGAVNDAIRGSLDELLETFDIVHLCGEGKLDEAYAGREGYVQYEYISAELPDLFALCDMVVSRAGANAIFELLSLKKPALLIPLGLNQSRGDQILNAESFKKQGFVEVLDETTMTRQEFTDTVEKMYKNRETYIANMNKYTGMNSIKVIADLIDEVCAENKIGA